jgi:hypothetical protein
MLTIIDRQGREVRPLDPEEHEALLAAFTRPGAGERARERGAAVVRQVWQHRRWFRCDCLGPGEAAPLLVPVAGTHIRRDPNHPDHAEDCPFAMDAEDRACHAMSLRVCVPRGGFRLARAFPQPEADPDRDEEDDHAERDAGGEVGDAPEAGAAAQTRERGLRKAYHRTSLAQLLFALLSEAGVHRLDPAPRERAAQERALRAGAQSISLGGELRLSDVLETDPDRLGTLLGRVAARSHWPSGRRPHGVLVFIAGVGAETTLPKGADGNFPR